MKEEMSRQERFLLEDVADTLNGRLIVDGWITMCHFGAEKDNGLDFQYYSYLVSDRHLVKEKQTSRWTMTPGSEGTPSIWGALRMERSSIGITAWQTRELSQIIFYRFSNIATNKVQYFDISEEYIFYYNLYENSRNRQKRVYYKIDGLGELEDTVSLKVRVVVYGKLNTVLHSTEIVRMPF